MDNSQYSEAEIIAQVVAGQTRLYEILIRRYNPFLYKTGRSYNFDHEDTQDLMQESFIDAYFNLQKFEGRASFKTWLIKIMLNKCWHRNQKASAKREVRMQMHEYPMPLYASADTEDVMNKELNTIIEKSLSAIPENYRMVFALREINGLSVAETAETLDITESNVKVRLNRAKSMLRSEIEKSYSAEEIYDFNLVYCNAIVNNVMARIAAIESEKHNH